MSARRVSEERPVAIADGGGIRIELADLNGEPGIVGWLDGAVYAVAVLESDGERLHAIRIAVNPDKLGHL